MKVGIVGAGPAGLMAAETAAAQGATVTVFDHMPSPARKFLMAGKSGLNITHAEDPEAFLSRYHDARMEEIVRSYGGAAAVRSWMAGLGIEERVGPTGRVFPVMMKASPLLRAWLQRLEKQGVTIRRRHRWTRWDGGTQICLETPTGKIDESFERLILACGGGSWRRLGSDGAWADVMAKCGVSPLPFKASNAGLLIAWSDVMQSLAGTPLKNIRLTAPSGASSRGECVITKTGLESGGIFPLAKEFDQGGDLLVDLLPDLTTEAIIARLDRQSAKQSLANRLRKAVKIDGVKRALLREVTPAGELKDHAMLASRLKALPLAVSGLAPLDDAISTRGGVPWSALDEHLELKAAPGVFCAGEMIDWDAPTGGYLLTACLASGQRAGFSSSG